MNAYIEVLEDAMNNTVYSQVLNGRRPNYYEDRLRLTPPESVSYWKRLCLSLAREWKNFDYRRFVFVDECIIRCLDGRRSSTRSPSSDLKVSDMYRFVERDKKQYRVNKGGWKTHLLLKKKDKRGNYTNTPRIRNRLMYKQRDPIVKNIVFRHQRFCDYEMDLMHGSKGYALVIVERKSRNVFIATQDTKNKGVTKRNVIRLLRSKKVLTLTCDNGSGNASYVEISEKIGAPIYFCHPGKPKEKGQLERMHGCFGIIG